MNAFKTFLLATAVLVPAALSARPMTPEDVARIAYTGTIAVSRDGSHIAYTTYSRPDVTRGEDNGGGSHALMLADGPMQARAYLPEDVSASSIGFFPDGSMITYLWAAKDDDRAVWGVPVDGGAPRKLAGVADASVSAYQIAPSGESIYLLVSAASDDARKDQQRLGFDAVVFEEEERFNRLFVAASGTAEIDPSPAEIAVPGHVDTIRLAPDGTFMVVTSAPTPRVDDSYVARRPYIIDFASGETRAIETSGKIGDIEIAPGSRTLSMIAATDEHDPAATTLYMVDVATARFTAVNEGAAEAAVDTEWMADGRLAVIVDIGAQSVLRFYSDDGALLREIDTGGLILTSLEQGGNRLAVEANSPAHPNELFLYSGSSFERWSDHNPWLAEIDFGTQRTLTYTARDGQEIEGILIEPAGGIPFTRAPTILDVHGGPESHESNGWVTSYGNPGQVAAGAGYAVFLPNYRGSTAYGPAFSKQHSGHYTDPEFADLVDAKYALADMGITDPERVGVTGSSYGGYATAWSATYNSEEFAAGVVFAGISNNLSKWGETDIPQEMRMVHALQYPWENWQKLLETSPIYYADLASTPLLILHGEEDTRVHPSQSLELYRHIKVQRPDTPLRLVLYPGEGHGNAKAAARYDYNLRMMEWFDTYLMSGDRSAPMPPPRPALKLEEDE
ncbi:S9 family peptidase [Alteraurantiacibacter aestuarii]|uniref:Prolyl oligopeptidase family serine peptidase n=1 Tax=Alteraurantiacibacter aestuarii TaxID=650004 RepID=A0A844ZK48_9SPHN|nr:S9 family peptidase [Alteraurantiacibacter aestuarii]MXO87516.1 prolyl oligopeptidase family serine peptidase [Alteraurantiacibacter aestuarii]